MEPPSPDDESSETAASAALPSPSAHGAPTASETVRRRSLGRQERSKETRRNLIRTAARLWGERGFDAVTVEEICSAAGVGRTTFYLHFESKERLLSGLAAATAAGVESEVEELGADAPLEVSLDVFVRGVARRMDDVPKALAELVIHSQHVALMRGRLDGSGPEPRRFADLLCDVLARARARGELEGGPDARELGEMLGALTMDTIEAWASGRSGARPLDLALRSRLGVVLDQYRP
jgi:AcrR family transcriptional regulator